MFVYNENHPFQKEKIAENLYVIEDSSLTKMYLLIGEKGAVLMDTGIGVGNLYEYVRRITDKPITVLITHGHLDHAMGAATFAGHGAVYMNWEDLDIYPDNTNLASRMKYQENMQSFFEKDAFVPEEKDWMKPIQTELIKDLKPGMSFDLGDEVVEVYTGRGHTRGCLTFLLRNHRILLLGDACNFSTFLFGSYSMTVSEYMQGLLELKQKTDGKYDRVLQSHGQGSDGTVDLIDGAVFLCEAILRGEDRHIPTVRSGMDCYLAKKFGENDDIGDHSTANIIYSDATAK